ncbi:MAG: ABC transporter permease [Spirochaetales bacterium]|nr:ABC transporter permease [Spirochaetales bacterium]
MMELITTLLIVTLRAGTSLLYATIGEIYTERSGILNLGVEGMMMLGAVTAFSVVYATGNLILGLIMAMLVSGLMALVHAFLSITMRANQVVSGLSVTLFGTGLASYLGQRLGPESNGFSLSGMSAEKFTAITIPGLSEVPILSAFLNQDIITYLLYLIVPISWYFLYRTKHGLTLRAVGENPKTASAMGSNVSKIRYIYTLVGGMLVGLGGAHLTLAYTPGWAENITGGRGWIVIALVIFSGWNPSRAVFGAILFGGINAVQFRLQAAGTNIPASFLNMAPYLATVVVLAVMTILSRKKRGKFASPSALGSSFSIEDK